MLKNIILTVFFMAVFMVSANAASIIGDGSYTILSVGGIANQNATSGDPAHMFEIVNDNTSLQGIRFSTYGSSGSSLYENTVHLIRMGGTAAAPSRTLSGMTFLSLGVRGYDGGITGSPAGEHIIASENWDSTHHGVNYDWQATADGSSSRGTIMLLDNSGNLTINGTLTTAGCTGCGSGSSIWSLSGTTAYYNSGPIGIGTTSPVGAMDVEKSSGQVSRFVGGSNTPVNPLAEYYDQVRGPSVIVSSYDGTNTGGYIATYPNYPLMFSTFHQAAQMIIMPSGNVGIGTTTPAASLDVNGSYASQGTVGVSCTAGTVNPTTMTVKNGIVTHC